MPATEALVQVGSWLSCPTCSQSVSVGEGALACGNGHRFDVARQGYVNLLGAAAPKNADTPPMLEARAQLLASGAFAPIAAAVATARPIENERRLTMLCSHESLLITS